MMQLRKFVLMLLVAIFLVQGWRVYTDETGRRQEALPIEARRGQNIWRANNCQTCHQIFGLGGFLGADLTNVTARFTLENFAVILKNGPPPMPEFPFSDGDVKDLYSFLGTVNATGKYPIEVTNKKKFIFSEIPWFSSQ